MSGNGGIAAVSNPGILYTIFAAADLSVPL